MSEEDCTTESLAALILENVTVTAPEAVSDATKVGEIPRVDAEITAVVEAIGREAVKLAKATEPVPTDAPSLLTGLDSIIVIQLYFWLQSEYNYEEDICKLFWMSPMTFVVSPPRPKLLQRLSLFPPSSLRWSKRPLLRQRLALYAAQLH